MLHLIKQLSGLMKPQIDPETLTSLADPIPPHNNKQK
jgi:hypothetical protein